MLKEKQRTVHIPRTIELLFGVLVAIISLTLFLLCFALVVLPGIPHFFKNPMGITILSVPASLGILFFVIAFNLLWKNQAMKRELMSIYGWKGIALFMFVLAAIEVIFGYWIGIIMPITIAFLCLLKDPKFRKFFYSVELNFTGKVER